MFENWRTEAKNRGTNPGIVSEPKPPWTPTIPEMEPWRSVYMRLPLQGQQLWDSLSPAARRNTFGI